MKFLFFFSSVSSIFGLEKKAEEWGLQGVKLKLQESEDTLAEERRKWRVACERENQRMFVAHTKITNLKVRVEELTKFEADFKERYEEAKSHRERVDWERVEVLQVELEQKLIVKDKDLAGKDVEIAELKRRLHESQETLEAEKQKGKSLEIDLMAERVKAESAKEARMVSQMALNVAQDNYVEVQSTMGPLINNLDWLQNYGIAHISNSIFNSAELDGAVVALIVASKAAGDRAGYVELSVLSKI
ncbi:hypothetical protein Hanom_Chr10g00951731 [Helianthus anomalus]